MYDFINKKDFEGFISRPAGWKVVEKKFRQLAEPRARKVYCDQIVEIVKNLEDYRIKDLMSRLAKVR